MTSIDTLLSYPVVMMCGVSGAGKTFIARKLEAEGYERLSPDRIVWNRYGHAYAELPPAERHEIYMAAIDSQIARLPELIASGRRVVIDCSMCKRRRRDAVASICATAGISSVIAYLTASREVLERRLSERGDTGPDDQTVSPADLNRFLAGFEAPMSGEHFITVNSGL